MIIIFPVKVYQKIRAYVESTKLEISGLGKILIDGDEIFIQDVRILRQVVSPANTVLDRNGLGEFYDQIITEEGDLSNWKLWWHSHADMDTFFSGTDLATIEDFDNETPHDNWMFSLVTNRDGDIMARIDIFNPLRCTIPVTEWKIDYQDPIIKVQALDEVAEKVMTSLPVHPKKNEIDFKKPAVILDRDGKPIILTSVSLSDAWPGAKGGTNE